MQLFGLYRFFAEFGGAASRVVQFAQTALCRRDVVIQLWQRLNQGFEAVKLGLFAFAFLFKFGALLQRGVSFGRQNGGVFFGDAGGAGFCDHLRVFAGASLELGAVGGGLAAKVILQRFVCGYVQAALRKNRAEAVFYFAVKLFVAFDFRLEPRKLFAERSFALRKGGCGGGLPVLRREIVRLFNESDERFEEAAQFFKFAA